MQPLTSSAIIAFAMARIADMTPDERAQVATDYSDPKTPMSSADVKADLARLSLKLRLSAAASALDSGDAVKDVVSKLNSGSEFPLGKTRR